MQKLRVRRKVWKKGKGVWDRLDIAMMMLFSSCDFFTKQITDALSGINDYKVPPIINTNTINFEITGIGTQMRAYDNFPSVTLFVKATQIDRTLITDLQEPDFFEAVEDNSSARPIYVTARGAVTSTNKKADIVFVFDTTGSMYGYLSTMTSKAKDFADTLASSDIDYKLGYVTFGDDIRKGTGERLAPTSNIEDFKTAIGALAAYGGDDGPENQIDALDYARASAAEASTSNPWGSFQKDMDFTYRSGAKKVFILITDIGYHTPDSEGDVWYYQNKHVVNTPEGEVAKLIADEVATYIIGPTDQTPVSYESIATATGGTFYSSGSDFEDIIDTLGGEISSLADYTILFMTDDFTASKLHTVRIAVHSSKGSGQATSTFTSPSVMDYSRAFKKLNEQKSLMILKQ